MEGEGPIALHLRPTRRRSRPHSYRNTVTWAYRWERSWGQELTGGKWAQAA
ncbi:hypothetical protein D187_005430 [Cystobacter fuscus DSM 2262]|uniref:Uncharacterized protein n=1 Tax=Cystobacter fuscus (strain ATCC 25194 / DSM 2262 / NBRC 100088 / M29) TaxID=1242864 RepID=S9PMM8_CYSF2|nr:hypothetical protein D187_005430 [Cystobacter fuscus DSM 2262]